MHVREEALYFPRVFLWFFSSYGMGVLTRSGFNRKRRSPCSRRSLLHMRERMRALLMVFIMSYYFRNLVSVLVPCTIPCHIIAAILISGDMISTFHCFFYFSITCFERY